MTNFIHDVSIFYILSSKNILFSSLASDIMFLLFKYDKHNLLRSSKLVVSRVNKTFTSTSS